MGKQITIPLGYNIADNDIGTGQLIQAPRTYRFDSVNLLNEISRFFKISTNNIGLITKLPDVNPWAAFKPTKYGVPTLPKHYHGVDVNEHNRMVYMPPVGGAAEPYHPDHFFGYNHNARLPGQKLGGLEIYGGDGNWSFTIKIALPEFDLRFPVEGFEAGTIEGVIIKHSSQIYGHFTPITDEDVANGFITCTYYADVSGETTSLILGVYLGKHENDTPYELCYFPNQESHRITLKSTATFYEATAEVNEYTPDVWTVSCENYHSNAIQGTSIYEFRVFKNGFQDGDTIITLTNDTYTINNADSQTIYQFQTRVNINGDGVWRDWIWSNQVQTEGDQQI